MKICNILEFFYLWDFCTACRAALCDHIRILLAEGNTVNIYSFVIETFTPPHTRGTVKNYFLLKSKIIYELFKHALICLKSNPPN